MVNISKRNDGEKRFAEYFLQNNDRIDSLTLGMLVNNNIEGINPVTPVKIGNDRVFKYDITNLITLKEYFGEYVKKEKLLKAFYGIAVSMKLATDYMINWTSFVLDEDNIYVEKETETTRIICIPLLTVINDGNTCNFFKNILFTAQFDDEENGEYVGKLITLLNPKTYTIDKFIHELEDMMGIEHRVFETYNEEEDEEVLEETAKEPENKEVKVSQKETLVKETAKEEEKGTVKEERATVKEERATVKEERATVKEERATVVKETDDAGEKETAAEVKKEIEKAGKEEKETGEEVKKEVKKEEKKAETETVKEVEKAKEEIKEIKEEAKEIKTEAVNEIKKVKEEIKGTVEEAEAKAANESEKVKETIEEVKKEPEKETETPKSKEEVEEAKKELEQTVKETAIDAVNATKQIKEEAEEAKEEPKTSKEAEKEQEKAEEVQKEPVKGNKFEMRFKDDDATDNKAGKADNNGETSDKPEQEADKNSPFLYSKKRDEKVSIKKERFVIGSDKASSDYYIKGNPNVEPNHAFIVRKGNEYYLSDNDTLEGTVLDHLALFPDDEMPLRNGMQIEIAGEILEFRAHD